MALVTVFDCNNYQDYLEKVLPIRGEERGVRSKLALYLDCRVSHITQVIQGLSHFSPEMALKTADFLQLDENEMHFFLLLVNRERAGNHKLKTYYQNQIDDILKDRANVKNRLEVTDELSSEQIMHYYSSWHYSAIHILCSLESVKSYSDIRERINLPVDKIKEAVSFLIESKILDSDSEGLRTTGRRIHLDAKNKMISKHHTNWRIKAIEEVGVPKEKSLHFSAVYSFSRKDWETIKEVFLKSLKSSEEIIEKSPEDMVGAICLDFFEIHN
jgi:uncharacterized protein (TIGR02147 family)